MSSQIVKILILVLLAVHVFASYDNCTDTCSSSSSSSSSFENHLRTKRWLTFKPNGGVAKLVVGFVAPIRFLHSLRRLCNMAWNVQANYMIPPVIIWPLPESFFKNRMNEGEYEDRSRAQLYQLIERMFHNFGGNGRECVLRTICEVAESPLKHNGMIGEILDVVFTPYDSDEIEEVYKQAKLNGNAGMDCVETYKGCPLGHGLLEQMTLLFHKYEVQ